MSDFNINNSAINANTAKNRKKKAKKKAKNKTTTTTTTDSSSTPSELSTPTLTEKEYSVPPPSNGEAPLAAPVEKSTTDSNTAIITETQTTAAHTSTLSGEASALASSLPAKPIQDTATSGTSKNRAIITDAQTTPADTSALSGEGSALASSLPAKPIDESHGTGAVNAIKTATATSTHGSIHDNNIPAAGPVGPGAHGATAAGAAIAAASTLGTAAGAGAAATTTEHSHGASLRSKRLPLSDTVKSTIESVIASRSISLDSIVAKIKHNVNVGDYKEKAKLPADADKQAAQAPTAVTTNSSKNPVKKAVAGVGAAVAGATTVAARRKSSKTNTTTYSTLANKAAAPPPPPTPTPTPEVTIFSESVQHCIRSAVQARSVDVYGILDASQKLKRPEPAVGSSAQPTMPSSAKAPDVPKKAIKSPEHRNKPSFLKKKNCIIL